MMDMKMKPKKMEPAIKQVGYEAEQPEYPYGLKIDLCNESLEKLQVKELPAVGEKFMVTALVSVCSTSINECCEGEAYKNVTLQITDMELKPLAPKKPLKNMLYGEEMDD